MEKYEELIIKRDLEATERLMISQSPQNSLLAMVSGVNHFKDNNYDCLYAHGTEDMRTYYQEFNKPKTFLSIAASGDQIINASLSGAEYIDAFDSNRLCHYALDLKIAALKGLTKEEFINYYETFSPFLFVKFAKYLNESSLTFWGNLYQLSDPLSIGSIIKNFIFSYRKLDRLVVTDINPYLKGKNYDKAKYLIQNTEINFIASDLFSLDEHLGNKKYDAINLSNIYEYINFGKNTSPKLAKKYYSFVFSHLYPRLNDNGTLMLAYLYGYSDKVDKEFKELYKNNPDKLTYPGAITLDEMPYYLMGLTTQNLSYSQLFDLLGNNGETVKKVLTKHIEYGQSTDMSHDIAICIKK